MSKVAPRVYLDMLKDLERIRPLDRGLSIKPEAIDAVETAVTRHWADIKGILRADPRLTLLERNLLVGDEKEGKTTALHGMVPAGRLLAEEKVADAMTEIAKRVVGAIQRSLNGNADKVKETTVGQVRALIVFKLRNSLKSLKGKDCLIGSGHSVEGLQRLVDPKLAEYTAALLSEEGLNGEIPRSKRKIIEDTWGVNLIKSLEIVNEDICQSDAEVLEKLNRSMKDAFELYNDLGNELFKHEADVQAMYRHYFPRGSLHKRTGEKNPLTSLDNSLKSISFVELCKEFFQNMKNPTEDEGANERMYHIQVILWLTIGFFQLNQRPGRAKEGVRRELNEVVGGYFQKLSDINSPVENTEFEVNGKTEPITLRKIDLNGRKFRVYAGESHIGVKKSTPCMLRLIRNGTKELVIPDMLRGETVFFDQKAADFNEETGDGRINISTAQEYLRGLGEEMGLSMDDELDYMNLRPGKGCIKTKIGKKGSPESFQFTAIKLYGNLVFAENKTTGTIVRVSAGEISDYPSEEWILHEERVEYRVVPGDVWKTANYNKLHPSHHDHFRLKQSIEIAEYVVRPPENPGLYRNMRAQKGMISACEKREREKLKASKQS